MIRIQGLAIVTKIDHDEHNTSTVSVRTVCGPPDNAQDFVSGGTFRVVLPYEEGKRLRVGARLAHVVQEVV